MSQRKAGVIVVGGFDVTGRPVGWEFDRQVRINERKDGTWTMGGHTKEELEAIVLEHAPEEEKKDVLPVVAQTPAPDIFRFTASIVGVAAKKPAKLPVHKEVKLLTMDVDELAHIDKLLDSTVEVMIIKRGGITSGDEFFEKFKEKFKDDETESESETAAEKPEHKTETKKSELDLESDAEADGDRDSEIEQPSGEPEVEQAGVELPLGENVASGPVPEVDEPAVEQPLCEPAGAEVVETAPAPEPEGEAAIVCKKCGFDLHENPDDPTQLVCENELCGEVYINTNAESVDFD